MAKWKETLEPYVKVIESVKTVASNPTAGEDLIVGAVIISDSGPATPTLITSQKEFLKTYAAEDLTQEYTDSLDSLYTSDPGSPLASTMWLNAYRLAGSTNLLVCRASKAKDLIYAKPIDKGDQNSYVLKNTEILKRVPSFKLVLDRTTAGYTDGWAISISDTGIIGNRVTDDGPIYDYKVDTLPELVDQLNDTTKFFSPTFHFYSDVKCTDDSIVEGDDIAQYADEIVAVKFDEVYLGSEFLDTETPLVDFVDNETGLVVEDEDGNVIGDNANDYQVIGLQGTKVEVKGMCYLLAVDPDWEELSTTSNAILDLNSKAYSGFDGVKYYATNLYNSRSDLQVRIRRFNHNAVVTKVTSDIPGMAPESPYVIATKVLDKYTAVGTKVPADSILKYDFYEFAIKDPDISEDWQLFNVGNIGGRGDITVADLNDNLSMMHLTLPDNLLDLGLNYYGYTSDDHYNWKKISSGVIGSVSGSRIIASVSELPEIRYKKNGSLNGLTKDATCSVLLKQHYEVYKWKTLGAWSRTENTGIEEASLSDYTLVSDPSATLPEGEFNTDDLFAQKVTTGENVTYDIYKYTVTGGVWESFVPDTTGIDEYSTKGITEVLPADNGERTKGDLWGIKKNSISEFDIYQLKSNGEDEVSINLSLKRADSVTGKILTTILDVSDNDLMQAWDRIEEDERYVVEGMTDLGNTYSILQNYMANIAVNSNYFYAASTINSTNYMTIANKKQKITKDTSKLYFLAPWDYDDGTVGYLYNASPSVLYWECVSRNKTNNNEFAPTFGQTTGIVTPVKLAKDFKKSERQLLLTKKINTIFHDVNIERIYINDSYTAQSDDNIRKEENIERTIIHISKNMPTLLNQFKGRINSPKTRQSVVDVIEYWFKSHLIPATGELIDDYRIICDDELNPPEEQRANRLNVKIQVRYLNSIKYISLKVVYLKFIKLLERLFGQSAALICEGFND